MIGMLLNVVHLQVHKKHERHSLLRGEAGEEEKESVPGTMGRGLFPLPIVPHALSIFLFYWEA